MSFLAYFEAKMRELEKDQANIFQLQFIAIHSIYD